MIYQTFAPFDNSTAANIVKWAQAFGQALNNFGWQQQSGHGEVVASLVSGAWTWTTTPATPTGGTSTRTGALNLHTSAPLTLGLFTGNTSAVHDTNSFYEMDFSGDADNFRMCPFRNGVANGWSAAGAGPPVLVIDRAKTATGVDADGYVYVGWLGLSNNTTAVALSAIILKPTAGGIIGQTVTPMWIGVVTSPAGSLGIWGSSPPMPILPLVGYTANPLLGAVAVQAQDWASGAVVPVWMYGAAHKYLVCGSDTTFSGYRQINGIRQLCCASNSLGINVRRTGQ